MDLTPLIASFLLFIGMELGDKTQLAVFTMSMRGRSRDVFIGAIAAFALIDGASIGLGGLLNQIVSSYWINLGSGLLFLLLSLLCLLRDEGISPQANHQPNYPNYKCTIPYAFSVILLMELGDKTQLVCIILSARYSNPIMVFFGVISASIILTGCAVLIGRNIMRFIPNRYLRYITPLLFTSFGLIFIIKALFGLDIL